MTSTTLFAVANKAMNMRLCLCMIKQRLAFILVLALLLGAAITAGTARLSDKQTTLANNYCGFSVDTTTQARSPLNGCLEIGYGWPVRYLRSSLLEILHDYHTINPGHPGQLVSAIASSDIEAGPLLLDWLVWSAVALLAVGGAGLVLSPKVLKHPEQARRTGTHK
jgi:hypothetical protein